MNAKTLKDIDVENKKVLLRVDFNVPFQDGKIVDDSRIVAALDTIKYLIDHNAIVIICSHLGRPDGKKDKKYSLEPVANYLAKLLQKDVLFVEDIFGKNTKPLIENLEPKDVVLLENVRFYKQEEECEKEFSKKLASLADIYVNDAFGTMHRKHASTYGVAEFLPSAVGLLVEKELSAFDKLNNPERPLVAILGGAKVKDKLPIVENLLNIADTILIGGGMSYTFVKAIGGEVGDSLVDETKVELAGQILEKAKEKGVKIVLPIDNVCANAFRIDAEKKSFNSAFIPMGYQGMDIGKKTIKLFKKYIRSAKTIVWNGPMGVYEFPRFAKGTIKIAKAVAKSRAYSIIGGGDSAASIKSLKLNKKVGHISTGGGVSLRLLEGKTLPAVDIISSQN